MRTTAIAIEPHVQHHGHTACRRTGISRHARPDQAHSSTQHNAIPANTCGAIPQVELYTMGGKQESGTCAWIDADNRTHTALPHVDTTWPAEDPCVPSGEHCSTDAASVARYECGSTGESLCSCGSLLSKLIPWAAPALRSYTTA